MKTSTSNLLKASALALVLGSGVAWAGGQFTGQLPSAYQPFTGNETLPLDTNLGQGAQPQTMSGTLAQLGTYSAGFNGSFRNTLVGGDFSSNPWIRGTSSGDIANTLTYQADRWWNLGGVSSAINVTKQTGASDVFAGTGASLRFQRKSANTNTAEICTGQVLESTDSFRFQGGTAVFSFTAQAGANFSAASSIATVTIAYGTGTDGTSTAFAGGTWTGYTAAVAKSVVLTTAFVRSTVVAAIPTTANQVGVKICYTPVGTAGANDWLEFGQAQLESSSQAAATAVASVFELERISNVVVRTQRHAWTLVEPAADVCQGAGYSTATTAARVTIPSPAPMRAAPTVSSIGAALAATTWKVQDAATPIVLSTPFLATYTANTVLNIALTATTGATQTVGRGVLLCGAGGGGILLVSADL